jgi:hypothetical protein
MEKGELERSGNILPKNCKPDNPVAIYFLYRDPKDRGKKPIRLPRVSQKSQQFHGYFHLNLESVYRYQVLILYI